MNIKINRTNKVPIYLQISTQIKHQILSRELPPGAILPSERALGKALSIHRNTVSKAYNELKAEELIESVQGKGYLVQGKEREKSRHLSSKYGKRVNWDALIKEEYLDMQVSFDDLFQRFSDTSKISMGSGLASPGIYHKDEIAKELSSFIAEEGKNQYFYSPYQGDLGLRQQLVSFFRTKGIKTTTGEIQILTETNQALDFIVMLLVKPGDTVIMEEPVSPDAYRAMELAGARIITIPIDQDGLQVSLLENLVAKSVPKLVYLNSSFHDPSGMILSMTRREKIIELSKQYRIPIIEEDAASELVYQGERLPPLKALDEKDNIIYIYSFSLTFVPGLSLAVVVANKKLIESLSYLVSVRMMSIDWIAQKLIGKSLENGRFYDYLNDFCENYRKKQKIVCNALDEMKPLGISYLRPRGGVYIWCKLPEGIDSKVFIQKAYQNGVTLIPGHVFFPFKNGGRDHIRINYSFETEERIQSGMEIFKNTILEQLAQEK